MELKIEKQLILNTKSKIQIQNEKLETVNKLLKCENSELSDCLQKLEKQNCQSLTSISFEIIKYQSLCELKEVHIRKLAVLLNDAERDYQREVDKNKILVDNCEFVEQEINRIKAEITELPEESDNV